MGRLAIRTRHDEDAATYEIVPWLEYQPGWCSNVLQIQEVADGAEGH